MSSLSKITSLELAEHAVKNEVMRYVGQGKTVVPAIIPFINNNNLNTSEALQYQGINIASFSSSQYDIPEGISVISKQVKKIPIITSRDSLFLMKYVKYWSRIKTAPQTWPPVSGTAIKNNYAIAFNKFLSTQLNGGLYPLMNCRVTASSSLMLPPTANWANFSSMLNGMVVIIPMYNDGLTLANPPAVNPSDSGLQTSYPGFKYKQVILKTRLITSMQMFELDGTTPFVPKWSGYTPVFFNLDMGMDNTKAIPFNKYLKVALLAKSPSALNIYGGLQSVPEMGNPKQYVDHVERVNVLTLQGHQGGEAHVETEYLFPIEGTINIEVENTFTSDLLVNGYVCGYKIFEKAKGL